MSADKELLKGTTAMLVLATIARKSLHGYEIIKELARSSRDYFTLGEGTVYPLLRKLEGKGLLRGYWSEGRDGTTGRRRRRLYELTPAGLAALDRRRELWRTFRDAVDGIIEDES